MLPSVAWLVVAYDRFAHYDRVAIVVVFVAAIVVGVLWRRFRRR